MKKILSALFLVVSLLLQAQNHLQKQLTALDGVETVRQIAGGKFLEKYELQFRQLRNPIGNPADTTTFLQRVIVGHIDTDSMVVLLHMVIVLLTIGSVFRCVTNCRRYSILIISLLNTDISVLHVRMIRIGMK